MPAFISDEIEDAGTPQGRGVVQADSTRRRRSFDGDGKLTYGSYKVQLLANIGNAADAAKAVAANAEGVGLFRTEFLFLDQKDEPLLEDQEKRNTRPSSPVPGQEGRRPHPRRRCRQPLPFLTDDSEPNPALGVRGYRTNDKNPAVLWAPAHRHRPRSTSTRPTCG